MPSSGSGEVLVNGVKTSASVSGSTLSINIPMTIQQNSGVVVDIPKDFGITNPAKPGNYKISVKTTSDETLSYFTVTIKPSVVSNVKFSAERSGISIASGYEIDFNTGTMGALAAGNGQIFIIFDKGFAMPDSISADTISVNGVLVSGVNITGEAIALTVAKDIPAKSSVSVKITENAGIKNPDKEGKYGVSVYTSAEKTPVESNKLSFIPLPSLQFVVQPSKPDGDNGYYITVPTVQIVSSKKGAIYYKLDDGDYSLYSSPIQIPDGDHTLYAYAVDENGNKGDVMSKEFKVDTKTPQITFDQGEGNVYVNSMHPTLTGKMNEPCSVIQVNGIDAKIDNKNLTFMVSLNVSNGGSLAVVAKALSGKTSSIVLTVFVDTTPPEVKLIAPAEQPFTTTENTYTIKFTVNEKCRSVEVNNTPVQVGGNGVYEFDANLTDGSNVFYITATDLAGNVTSVPVTIQKVNSIIIKLTIGSKTAYIGDKPIELDTAPIIKNNRTLVPLRFVSQAFGAKVEWNATTKTITLIYTPTP